jgi:membrane-bound metal-dependent hydrolase YbcI (DUF457 family)
MVNLIFTLLVAFPLGYFVRERRVALFAYLVAGAFLFTFQSIGLVLDYLAHQGRSAFGPFPDQFPIAYSTDQYIGYGLLNLVITTSGVGLVLLGARVRLHRERRRTTLDVADPSVGRR